MKKLNLISLLIPVLMFNPLGGFAQSNTVSDTALTFVLSNEESGLIDDLIATGHGNSNLYQAMAHLQNSSGGVISDEFLEKLANCPTDSDIFTAPLSNFSGLNNPVCINSDGTLTINGIFGRDYFDKDGFATYPETGVGRELFTYATSPVYYIDAGSSGISGGKVTEYRAFAIAWSNSTDGIPGIETNPVAPHPCPNPFTDGFYINHLPENARLEIYDFRGKLLYQTEPKDTKMVQPGQLPDGIYFLKLINRQGTSYQKIVKH
jgi:hypothetical protein